MFRGGDSGQALTISPVMTNLPDPALKAMNRKCLIPEDQNPPYPDFFQRGG